MNVHLPDVKWNTYSKNVATRGTFKESVRSMLRGQLLDAAAEALIAGGWSQLKMGDVATQVGVSRQTVYNEFGSKTGLGEALAMREAERFLEGITDRLNEHTDDLHKAIETAVEFTLAAAADNPVLKAVLTATRGGASELLPVVTSRSAPILVAATGVLISYLDEHWPEIDLEREKLRFVIESVVRLVVSNLVMPMASAADVATNIAWIADRILNLTPE